MSEAQGTLTGVALASRNSHAMPLPSLRALEVFFPSHGTTGERCRAAQARAAELGCVPILIADDRLVVGVVNEQAAAVVASALSRAVMPRIMSSDAIATLRVHAYRCFTSQPKALALLSKSQAIANDVIPLFLTSDGSLAVGVVDPNDARHLQDISREARSQVVGVALSLDDIKDRIQRAYAQTADVSVAQSGMSSLIDEIFGAAVRVRASDVHLETVNEREAGVWIRVDGLLEPLRRLSPQHVAAFIDALLERARVVGASDSGISHDGRLSLSVEGRNVDLRFSTMPTVFGTSLVARIGSSHDVILTLEEAGMSGMLLERYMQALRYPHGLLMVSGPVGQGKSSLIRSSMLHIARMLLEQQIKRPLRADEVPPFDLLPKTFRSVENPVETNMPWVRQTQVDKSGGRLSFVEAMEQFLRMDTDIMLVGEIRDEASLRTAIEGSLLGHYIFSTSHAGDSIRSLQRLLFKGAAPEDIAAGMIGILSMRLVRRLCACKRDLGPALGPNADPVLLHLAKTYLGDAIPAGARVFAPVGCNACRGKGYSGRVGIFEYFEVNDDVQDAILRKLPTRELVERDPGYHPMIVDAARRVLAGVTSISEVDRFVRWRL